ncbi:MAG: hypothetical protein JNK79_04900 [Chitinophagaceae bacterium]|nr:hypothetical protein [Chitinophagaceae bacterium]
MEPGRIKELLEKYWKAETNEAEEAELKEYFEKNDGAGDHPANPLFKYFREQQKLSLPSTFDEQFQTSMVEKRGRVKWIYPLMKAAAVILVVFSVVYIFLPKREPLPVASIEKDTYSDPQQAYNEAKKALLLISTHLNTGTDYIDEVGKLNKAEQLIHSKENK